MLTAACFCQGRLEGSPRPGALGQKADTVRPDRCYQVLLIAAVIERLSLYHKHHFYALCEDSGKTGSHRADPTLIRPEQSEQGMDQSSRPISEPVDCPHCSPAAWIHCCLRHSSGSGRPEQVSEHSKCRPHGILNNLGAIFAQATEEVPPNWWARRREGLR